MGLTGRDVGMREVIQVMRDKSAWREIVSGWMNQRSLMMVDFHVLSGDIE